MFCFIKNKKIRFFLFLEKKKKKRKKKQNMSRNKKVGKYELGKTLGSGSFSKVKLGVDDHGKQYAVKMIEKEQLVKEGMEDQPPGVSRSNPGFFI